MPSILWGDRAFRVARACTVIVASMLAAGSLYAQAPAADTTFHCDGKTITGIDVESQPPAIVGRDPSAVRRFMQHVLFQSGTTHESRIRAFLLAHIDERCSDELLPEVARVVRAEPYIASATVTAVSDGADGVRLKVETVDEVPVIIGGGISKGGLSNVKYGNSNIGGTGLLAAGQWRDGRAYRDGLSLSMRQYGLAGQPVVAELDAHREPLGGSFSADVSRPFFSDLEHIAWYMGGTHENAYRPFVRPSEDGLIVPVARDVWSTGVVARFSWKSAFFNESISILRYWKRSASNAARWSTAHRSASRDSIDEGNGPARAPRCSSVFRRIASRCPRSCPATRSRIVSMTRSAISPRNIEMNCSGAMSKCFFSRSRVAGSPIATRLQKS